MDCFRRSSMVLSTLLVLAWGAFLVPKPTASAQNSRGAEMQQLASTASCNPSHTEWICS
jgi:hypothetical protein